jgi:hypothetical protein
MYTFKSTRADGQSLIHTINLMLGDDVTGVELGVGRAVTTCTLLQNCPSLKIFAVDSWKPYSDYLKEPYDNLPGVEFDEKEIEFVKLTALHNIRYSGCSDRVRVLNMSSDEAVNNFIDNSLDFIFFDAHVTLSQLENDLEIWYSKVRKNGLVAVHDAHIPVVADLVDYFRQKHNITSKLSIFDETYAWVK